MSNESKLSAVAAEEIEVMLVRRRINKSGLARLLGVSHTWVTNRLSGQQEIGLNELQRIAAILNVEVTDLLPRASEGRVLTTGGQPRDEQGRGITIRKFSLPERPGPNGHPKRTQPQPSTRRPGRVLAAHAPS
ncbi:MAG TPA: helix-turn-helix transcriptional regulator [Candidatus Limnocylindrales bacterium]|nr:helix-turn-helix transcriptional regulator [Candidatus Limnocylindrales bacterium]